MQECHHGAPSEKARRPAYETACAGICDGIMAALQDGQRRSTTGDRVATHFRQEHADLVDKKLLKTLIAQGIQRLLRWQRQKQQQNHEQRKLEKDFCCALTQVIFAFEKELLGTSTYKVIKCEQELLVFFKARTPSRCSCLDEYTRTGILPKEENQQQRCENSQLDNHALDNTHKRPKMERAKSMSSVKNTKQKEAERHGSNGLRGSFPSQSKNKTSTDLGIPKRASSFRSSTMRNTPNKSRDLETSSEHIPKRTSSLKFTTKSNTSERSNELDASSEHIPKQKESLYRSASFKGRPKTPARSLSMNATTTNSLGRMAKNVTIKVSVSTEGHPKVPTVRGVPQVESYKASTINPARRQLSGRSASMVCVRSSPSVGDDTRRPNPPQRSSSTKSSGFVLEVTSVKAGSLEEQEKAVAEILPRPTSAKADGFQKRNSNDTVPPVMSCQQIEPPPTAQPVTRENATEVVAEGTRMREKTGQKSAGTDITDETTAILSALANLAAAAEASTGKDVVHINTTQDTNQADSSMHQGEDTAEKVVRAQLLIDQKFTKEVAVPEEVAGGKSKTVVNKKNTILASVGSDSFVESEDETECTVQNQQPLHKAIEGPTYVIKKRSTFVMSGGSAVRHDQAIHLPRNMNRMTKCSSRSCEIIRPLFKFTACSGCRSVFYCDVICQRNDWKCHSTECGTIGKKKDAINHVQ
mmetsp:Transcript_5792/g.11806  ORF Transcript_5792/g.11806 Transcript_5792/m.11806 type:complete len:698 (+) Transcript_5792:134-2227(+)